MTQKETIWTPYDEEIVRLEGISPQSHVERYLLNAKRHLQAGWLAGFETHGAERACGSEGCTCYQAGIEAGLEQAAEGKTGARP